MLTFATSRNLVMAAGLASAVFALGASAPSQAATKSLFNCQGTKFGTYRCCKEYQPKPLWFKQQALNCEDVITCEKKKCRVEPPYNPTYQTKQNTQGGQGGKGGQNGPNGTPGGSSRSRN